MFKGFVHAGILGFLVSSSVLIAVEGRHVQMPPDFKGNWSAFQRADISTSAETVTVANGFIASSERYSDAEILFRLRAPQSSSEVQAWAGFRVADQDRRYVVGLRGGNNNHIYLARYAPDADDAFLGVAPLDFSPAVGKWFTLRIFTLGNRIQVYLGDEQLPRINVVDADALWGEGAVAIGGGYLAAEYSPVKVSALTSEMREQFNAVGEKVWTTPATDAEVKRSRQRASYQPLVVAELKSGRNEISLNGDWLFLPDYQADQTTAPAESSSDDSRWHVLDVPNLWTPMLAWLHGEDSFKLKGLSAMKGVSDKVWLQEMTRLEGYTFDWSKTQGGWYRHHIELPSGIRGKKLEIAFDAIAKISEVFVNGVSVGSHVGMFGEVRCDISKVVQPGKNVIAVHVVRNFKGNNTSNKVVGVAVTVPITEAMLNSLPHAMYGFDPGGIWQPVKMVVTDPVSVADVFIQPSLDDAKFDIELANNASDARSVQVGYIIRSVTGGSILHAEKNAAQTKVPASGRQTVVISTPKLVPQLWAPHTPNLYELEIQVVQDGRIVDTQLTKFGFRTFTVSGNKFLLNGHPYWLRGGNHFPIALKPNDAELADKFVRLAKAGNVDITRTHVAPLTTTWAEATDRLGMLVSFEGIWPWLMLKGDIPAPGLIAAWKSDFSDLVRKYRNHPSVVMWTINNEMKFWFFDREDPDLMTRKWSVLSDMIKTLRVIDPTRPVVADSGYMRKENIRDYETIIKPNGFDDGDVDDAHRYYNWYNPAFTTLYKNGYAKTLSLPDRPLISQEMSTGYPRSDDGLPTRFYLFKHQTPQALVGKYAYEHNDPAIFLARQAFMSKQHTEVIRRKDHENSSGVMLFAYLTWFKDQFSKDSITPFPAYYALQSAMSPVLVSVELHGWHYFAGAKINPSVYIVNDSHEAAAVPAGRLQWEIESGGVILSRGERAYSAVPYYAVQEGKLSINLPKSLPASRTAATLKVRLVSTGKTYSENSYELTLADSAWAAEPPAPEPGQAGLYDTSRDLPKGLLPKSVTKLTTLASLDPKTLKLLIVAQSNKLDDAALAQVKAYAQRGGRVLLLHPGQALTRVLPEAVKSYRAIRGQIVTPNRAESPVFSGIEPLDLSWLQVRPDQEAYACEGVYSLDRTASNVVELAQFCEIHAYLQKPTDVLEYSGTPLIQASVGEGTIIASEMALSAAGHDPIARRLFNNLIGHLLSAKP